MISCLVANAGILGQVRHSFMEASIVEFVLMLTIVATIVDLAIGCVGYSLTLRLFDAHIRSPNRYLVAWVVCLACYFPISNVVIGQMFQYRNARDWTDVVTDYPLLMGPWMAAIVGLFAIYLWSKCVFGLRFSNLTHRGIVTNGPYRYTKHPDYVTKSIFFWLTAAPFLTAVDAQAAVTTSAALVAVNLMYWGRARTEEMHLSEDPDYVAYALAMNERSIFRRVPRFIPALRVRAPSGGEAMPAAPAMTPAE